MSWCRRAALLLALFVTAGLPRATACPFCNSQGTTLTGDANQASMILYGTLKNPQLSSGGDFGAGTTDFDVELIVKPHPILGDKKTITLPRYIPVDKENPVKYLVFVDVYQGKLDPYRGVSAKADSDIGKYLTGALALKDKDIAARLKYFFPFLQSSDPEVANDAFMEFGNTDYKDFRPVATQLNGTEVAKWLQDPNTAAARFGLYGSVLGHCGTKEHAPLLRKLLEDPDRRFSSGLDGMLAGYVMLDKAAGWQYTLGLLKDPKREILIRYAALRAVRFFHEYRPDVVTPDECVAAANVLLDQGDIADLAVEDLRKWSRWDMADKVLGMLKLPSHDVQVVKRSVLRFALSCPADKSPACAQFVTEMRAKDKEYVADAEELLKLEATPPKPPTPMPKPATRGGKPTSP